MKRKQSISTKNEMSKFRRLEKSMGTMVTMFTKLNTSMTKQFKKMNKRFENMDKRFAEVHDTMDKRFAEVHDRFSAVDVRFERVEASVEELKADVQKCDTRIHHTYIIIEQMRNDIQTALDIALTSNKNSKTLKEHDQRITQLEKETGVIKLALKSRNN